MGARGPKPKKPDPDAVILFDVPRKIAQAALDRAEPIVKGWLRSRSFSPYDSTFSNFESLILGVYTQGLMDGTSVMIQRPDVLRALQQADDPADPDPPLEGLS